MKKQDKAAAVSPAGQWLLVVAVLGGWAVETLAAAHQLATDYTSQGTWLFPALVFVTSLGFAVRRYGARLRQAFSATPLTAYAVRLSRADKGKD